MDDMDSISESTVAPFRHAQAQPQGPARLVMQGLAAYRHAALPPHRSVCHMLNKDCPEAVRSLGLYQSGIHISVQLHAVQQLVAAV